MGGLPPTLLSTPFQLRKLIDPAKREHIRIGQTKSLSEVIANRRERFCHDRRHVGDSEYQITWLSPNVRRGCGNLRFAQELGDWRANAVLVNCKGGKSFRPGSSSNLRKRIDLAARVSSTTRHNDRLDLPACCKRLGERAKFRFTKSV